MLRKNGRLRAGDLKRVPDPTAPYDAYDESGDTEKMAKSGFLKGVGR